jgi:hypothetical protein
VAGYTYPIGPGLIQGRIDEGVDWSGAGPLYALGDGTIVSVYNAGWPGGVYILLHLTGSGAFDGRWVYYAENIAPSVDVGQQVRTGDVIGYARGVYPYIEIGWGTSAPGVTAAAWHYTEGVPTPEGANFAAVLDGLRRGVVVTSGGAGAATVTGAEPAISNGAGPAIATLGTLTHQDMPGYGRGVRAITAAANRMYTG